jgi:hypothetical protein
MAEFTEIKLDKSTLPAGGQEVEFEVLGMEGNIKRGTYEEDHDWFWDNEAGEYYTSWRVLKWRAI